jgi:RNA 2',3'-cyclic 3'-phosphodiesterase
MHLVLGGDDGFVRLFAALVPPAEVLEELDHVVAPLRRDERVRWTPPDMWHITVAFFGEVDPLEEQYHMLMEGLAWAAAGPSLEPIRLQNATEFHGRVVAVEIAGGLEPLRTLAHRCMDAGRKSGLNLARRRYRPHVTVGRSPRPRDLSHLVSALIGLRSPEWTPSELVLMASHRGPNPRYDAVAAIDLSS